MKDHDASPQPVVDRWDGLLAVFLGLFSLALYVRTLLPGLIPNDSAEFQTLAYTFDHAHTTGYEVYVILTKLFTLLPIKDVAYRVNLFSAVMGGITIAVVYLIGRTLSGNRWAALIGAFALSISATFWSQAIIAEVYTAGSAFSSAILWLTLLWVYTRRGRFLFIAGLLGGLGIGVHGSVILLAPAVLVLLLLHVRSIRSFWKPAMGGLALGIGLLLLAFFAVDQNQTQASIFNTAYLPNIDRWDLQPEDLDSMGERFVFLVFARQWRSAMFTDPVEVMPGNIDRLLTTLPKDFALPILALACLGLFSLFKRKLQVGLFLLTAILVHHLYTFNYQIGDIYVFFLTFYVYLSALTAEGAAVLLRLFDRLPGVLPRLFQPALALLLFVAAAAPFASSRLAMLRTGQARWEFMDLSSNSELESWHREIGYMVKDLPHHAIVLMDWYNLYGYVYAAHVEQGRTDLLFIEAYPYSTKPGMVDSLFVFLRENIKKGRPVYTLNRLDELQRGGLRFYNRPVGVRNLFFVED